MGRFTVTYDVVTHESAEYGEVAESGFESTGGWKHDDPDYLTLKACLSACGLPLHTRSGVHNDGKYQIFNGMPTCNLSTLYMNDES